VSSERENVPFDVETSKLLKTSDLLSKSLPPVQRFTLLFVKIVVVVVVIFFKKLAILF
jgi:hypothetical protein